MRIVHSADEFSDALDGARREAMASFSDDRVLVEKYITRPRHIEVSSFPFLFLVALACDLRIAAWAFCFSCLVLNLRSVFYSHCSSKSLVIRMGMPSTFLSVTAVCSVATRKSWKKLLRLVVCCSQYILLVDFPGI